MSQDASNEVMILINTPRELVAGVHRGIDLSPVLLLHGYGVVHDLAEARLADDHHVDVAGGADARVPREGAVDEGNVDSIAYWSERITQVLDDTGSFRQDPPQLLVDGRSGVRVVRDRPSRTLAVEDSRRGQAAKLPLHRALTAAGAPDYLTKEKGLLRLVEQEREDVAPCLAEKRRRQRVFESCPHIRCDCTLIGCKTSGLGRLARVAPGVLVEQSPCPRASRSSRSSPPTRTWARSWDPRTFRTPDRAPWRRRSAPAAR